MSDNTFKEWSQLILSEMKRFDQNHRDIMQELGKIKSEQSDQGKTLTMNTALVDENQKHSNRLEKSMEALSESMVKLQNDLLVIKTEKKMAIYIISTLCASVVSFVYKVVPLLLNNN